MKTLDEINNNAEQFTLDTEQEWRVVHDASTSHPDSWHIRDGYNGDCLAHAGTERIAAQIVSDHNAAIHEGGPRAYLYSELQHARSSLRPS